jgi:peptide/nickel transport system substrate-binding protein
MTAPLRLPLVLLALVVSVRAVPVVAQPKPEGESADARTYDFKLREGSKFHNGDPFTTEDVKFSFQRAKGYRILKDKVREIEIVGPARVRFHLVEPWPDFLTFYGTTVAGHGCASAPTSS